MHSQLSPFHLPHLNRRHNLVQGADRPVRRKRKLILALRAAEVKKPVQLSFEMKNEAQQEVDVDEKPNCNQKSILYSFKSLNGTLPVRTRLRTLSAMVNGLSLGFRGKASQRHTT